MKNISLASSLFAKQFGVSQILLCAHRTLHSPQSYHHTVIPFLFLIFVASILSSIKAVIISVLLMGICLLSEKV